MQASAEAETVEAPARQHGAADAVTINGMSVDVEDYFQVAAFEGQVSREDWDRMPSRVEANTDRVLALFGRYGVKATFFTLGWVAERHAHLVRRIIESGHEVASHGYAHERVTEQTPEQFRRDVTRAKLILEDITGCAVMGYRAATYSIVRGTLWALDVLAEAGYQYSSSIYPIHHDLYGMPDAPRFAFRYGSSGILEIPITTTRLFGVNLPCGGGGYFRLLPYSASRWALRRVNRRERQSCVFYFHPWEIDPGQPRQRGKLRSRVRHYLNLHRMEARLERLLTDFYWDRLDRVFLGSAVREQV